MNTATGQFILEGLRTASLPAPLAHHHIFYRFGMASSGRFGISRRSGSGKGPVVNARIPRIGYGSFDICFCQLNTLQRVLQRLIHCFGRHDGT
jgi:hypothetical protein